MLSMEEYEVRRKIVEYIEQQVHVTDGRLTGVEDAARCIYWYVLGAVLRETK